MSAIHHGSFWLDAIADGGVLQARTVTLAGLAPFDIAVDRICLRANRTFPMMAVTAFTIGINNVFARDVEVPFAIGEMPLGIGGGVVVREGWQIAMTVRLPLPSILGIRPRVFAMLFGRIDGHATRGRS